ncbi:hypothetical protein EOA27_01450 [Mesorhizobium sp. M2A.F.Ca.ET.037.01.1.1]|uniref:hypothetical protein n=1 Tax=unclassified Mesorhizobium TaxID=325217 RepID=UPI000F7573B4|nr:MULTISPECIES: hypothetical protein [unclassified Mesorhizobium]RUY07386.1 hypothetical protein EOA25_15255 [Mesorhizobium sp. M2A.F.Ca.ET.040.01.1.1]RVC69066.1 hypothetical protein EN759_09445 [Mesorhizobium sp. M00.F.Ca.ET.038.03.1.1]RVC80309.1 hypothetical protein EN766_05625 [Mesorhizobium sp. M2A.F.Ca.ET.046.02.1.1]AZO05536.1 hypothetical protein EJ068_22530 [Mesorhizobium sp. M2A.F.Ca.ET.043.02.1.1]AZO34348.1 hypothetical protein EJ072_07710 [Mesorhizobium sp. M2A.F.Ca.ET.046.03.2.1]
MKHQTSYELQSVAIVDRLGLIPLATRRQRIERWAELLDRNPQRCLSALTGTEYVDPGVRERVRADGSPLAVAFDDPLLRAAGLQSDTYGEAKRFFELSDWQLHDVVCSCHTGATMQASWAAARVRRIVKGNRILGWLRSRFVQ